MVLEIQISEILKNIKFKISFLIKKICDHQFYNDLFIKSHKTRSHEFLLNNDRHIQNINPPKIKF